MRTRRFLLLPLFAMCAFVSTKSIGHADEPEVVPSISELRMEGLRGLEKRERAAASDAADRLMLHYENDPRAIRLAGDLYLRSGKIHTSIKQFERYIELVPDDKPELWQYGIALALVGRYEDGRKLFELHRSANPNDVENAAWHFLCVAKLAGMKEAVKLVLPAPGDTRVPMNEIRRLLIDGNEQRVTDAVNQLTEGSAGYAEANFYANLYLGLYADAFGNTTKAKRLIGEAAKTEQVNYMSDVARVYLIELDVKK
jgi:lipoprotein NlpI